MNVLFCCIRYRPESVSSNDANGAPVSFWEDSSQIFPDKNAMN